MLFVAAAVCGFVSAARASQPTSVVTVQIVDYAFSPQVVTVPPDTTVVFRNQGIATHRVVADDGSFDSNGIQPAKTWSITVTDPGTIGYHDEIYPVMRGQIVVSDSASAAGGDPFASSSIPAGTTPSSAAAASGSSTSAAATSSLASTGTRDAPFLALAAVVLLALGGAALACSRPGPVRLVALVSQQVDDLLPARDRARR